MCELVLAEPCWGLNTYINNVTPTSILQGLDYGGPSQEYFAGLSREIHQEDKLLAFQQKSSLCWFNEQFANKSMADCEEFKYVGVLLGE